MSWTSVYVLSCTTDGACTLRVVRLTAVLTFLSQRAKNFIQSILSLNLFIDISQSFWIAGIMRIKQREIKLLVHFRWFRLFITFTSVYDSWKFRRCFFLYFRPDVIFIRIIVVVTCFCLLGGWIRWKLREVKFFLKKNTTWLILLYIRNKFNGGGGKFLMLSFQVRQKLFITIVGLQQIFSCAAESILLDAV